MRPGGFPRRVDQIDWAAWNPVDRCTLVFVLQNGQVLLIRKKRGLGAGKVNGPGGRIQSGETPLDCAIRELQEEVGITPREPVACGELCFQFLDGYSTRVWVFRADGCDGKVRETEEAVPLWTPLARIPYDEMWEDDRIWLPHLLEGRPFRGRFIFDGDAMLDHWVRLG